MPPSAPRTATAAALAVAAALAAGPSPAAAKPRAPLPPPPREAASAEGPVEIEGNLVLVDEVYLAIIDLPRGAEPTADNATKLEAQVLAFLRRAGYALAQVEARVDDGRIVIKVDEGRLARIVVTGRDIISSLALQLQITLPYDVFNRPQLERTLAALQGGGRTVNYRLAPARAVDDDTFQLDPRAFLPGGAPLPVGPAAYELILDFSGGPQRGGLSLVAGIDPDSMRAGGELRGFDGVIDGDRWELETQVGANYFTDIERGTSELEFSRVFLDGRWLSPAFVRGTMRPSLRVREDLINRQRVDLLVESYWWNRLEGAFGFQIEPKKGIELSAEVGVQQRDLFGVRQLEGADVEIGSASALVWFTALTGRLILDPDNPRLDRRHRITLEARQSVATESDRAPFWLLDASYRNVFEVGWDELWIRGALAGVAGDHELADAIPLTGRFLRGVFGNDLYLDRAIGVTFEYRKSLQRDTFKIGGYVNGATAREAEGSPAEGEVHFGTSFGPTFHALILDVVQLDLSYAFGFLEDGAFDYGISFELAKAF